MMPHDDGPEADADSSAKVFVDVRDDRLGLDEVVEAVTGPGVGGIVTFTGVVRGHDGGRVVQALDYTAHPSAAVVLRDLATQIAGRPQIEAVAAVHRSGYLGIGEVAVVVAVGAAHRAAAFEACRELIDRLKETVPIWKHQLFLDGDDEWVGTA